MRRAAAPRRIIAIGASAGGVEPLLQIVRSLPADLDAAVLVVMHVSPTSRSALPTILARAGRLPAGHAADGEAVARGQIRVAPPDRHLIVEGGRLRTVRGPRENRSRPAVDVLFRSAARSHGQAVVGVVLSGALDDGAAGLRAIHEAGGLAVVQDPVEALHPSMPQSALRVVPDARRLRAADIGGWVADAVATASRDRGAGPGTGQLAQPTTAEAGSPEVGPEVLRSEDSSGSPSAFGCPDCGGALWEIGDARMVRFRCRVGHAFSADALLEAQRSQVEDGLWTALRALEEQASLADRLARRATEASPGGEAGARFADQAVAMRGQADAIRRLLGEAHGFDEEAVADSAAGVDRNLRTPVAVQED